MEITRKYIREVFLAGVAAVQPRELLPAFLRRLYGLPLKGKLWVWGAGKAAAEMARVTEELLGDRIAGGIVVTKYGHGIPLKHIRLLEASHPVPDENGVKAANAIREMLEKTVKDDLVVGLISGGASALMADVPAGIPLPALRQLSEQLIRSGAGISAINTVRKHLSTLKGGRLGQLIYPAAGYSFIISDVVGDPVDVIASGPTAPDHSTQEEAVEILKSYGLWEQVGPAIAGRLSQPEAAGPCLVHNIIIGNNELALEAAAGKARELGFEPRILSREVAGEAHRVAAELVKEARKHPSGTCLLMGGETTVTVKGPGKGGRNQEFALAALTELRPGETVTILSGGTDGTDGPTGQAGAIADQEVWKEAARLGVDPREYLKENDSWSFFKQTGGHLYTGPTQTNIMDIMIALKT